MSPVLSSCITARIQCAGTPKRCEASTINEAHELDVAVALWGGVIAACNRGKRPLRQKTRIGTTSESAKKRAPVDRIAPVKQRRSASIEFFSGLDVSIDETAICVVDDKGAVHLQMAVATDPEAIVQVLKPFLPKLRRVGHEAGSLSPWLHPELAALGLPVVCLETQHVRAAMSAQRNKTDAADALGIAHIMRTGWFRQAYIKTEACYRIHRCR